MEAHADTLAGDLLSLSCALQYHSRCLRFSCLISTCYSKDVWDTYWSASDSIVSMQMAWTLLDWEATSRQNQIIGVHDCMHIQCGLIPSLHYSAMFSLPSLFPIRWLKSFWKNSLLENLLHIKYVKKKESLLIISSYYLGSFFSKTHQSGI